MIGPKPERLMTGGYSYRGHVYNTNKLMHGFLVYVDNQLISAESFPKHQDAVMLAIDHIDKLVGP